MIKILITLLIFSVNLYASREIPTLYRYVNDQTNTLTQIQINELEKRLKKYEDTTTNQIVVLIISSLGGEDVVDYSHRVAENNKIGQKGKDNGILILVVKNDRKIRIEVGYGLEEVIPDAVASSIIRNIMIPYFKADNYYEGLSKGIETLQHAIAGTYKVEQEENKSDGFIVALILIIVAIIFYSVISTFAQASRGGWKYTRGGWHTYPKRQSGWGGFSGFGGFGGGGFGGGGFGGGGFSGGGGSFGGGGASGSW